MNEQNKILGEVLWDSFHPNLPFRSAAFPSEWDCAAQAVKEEVLRQLAASPTVEEKPEPTPWKLPDPPSGRRWLNVTWTSDMLPDGYRPMLEMERIERGDEFSHDRKKWEAHGDGSLLRSSIGILLDPDVCDWVHHRTRRSLPTTLQPEQQPSSESPGQEVKFPTQTSGDGTSSGRLSIFARGWNGCLKEIQKLNPHLTVYRSGIDVSRFYWDDLETTSLEYFRKEYEGLRKLFGIPWTEDGPTLLEALTEKHAEFTSLQYKLAEAEQKKNENLHALQFRIDENGTLCDKIHSLEQQLKEAQTAGWIPTSTILPAAVDADEDGCVWVYSPKREFPARPIREIRYSNVHARCTEYTHWMTPIPLPTPPPSPEKNQFFNWLSSISNEYGPDSFTQKKLLEAFLAGRNSTKPSAE